MPHAFVSIRTSFGTMLAACVVSPLVADAAWVVSADGATVHDTVNDVSWLADFNLPATNRFGLPICGAGSDTKACVNASGSMSFQAATAWVNAMNAANYLGHGDWQLPTTPTVDAACSFVGPQSNSFGFGCTASALGSVYSGALGLKAPASAVAVSNGAAGPFTNFQAYLYWSQSSDAASGTGFSTFSFASGFLGSNSAPNELYVLPMIRGKLPGTPSTVGTGLQVNPGGQTVYDPVANVTWSANANLAASNGFGLPTCVALGSPKLCVNADGAMNADSASQFVANLNSRAYLGLTSWELPAIAPGCNGYGCASAGNPMGELYYGQLGLRQGSPVVDAADVSTGPFHHVVPYLYWSCLGAVIRGACQVAGPASGFEWSFSFGNGFEGTDILANDLYATAYFPGVSTAKANYQGMWWKAPAASESGWGLDVTHQGDVLFATWFTYDVDGSPLWLVMSDGVKTAEGVYAGTLFQTTGPPFAAIPWNPALVTNKAVGSATLTFSDAANGTFAYVVNGVSQSKAITRYVFSSPVPNCAASASPPSSNYQDLWWHAPAGSESGWGVNIAHQGDILFVSWFTYGATGKGTWFVMPSASKSAPGAYSGSVYQASGPAFSAVPWNPALVALTLVGTASLAFSDPDHGTFAYAVNGTSQSKPITRLVYASPTTVCD